MAKIGVGIGDEFPVEEGKPREETASPGKDDKDGGCKDDRRHREWSERHRHWHDHYKDWHGPFRYWRSSYAHRLLPTLFIIGGIALLIAIISHFFYFILGAAVLAALFYMHHNGPDGWDMHGNIPPSGER
ncbi:MAG TPA: hypothetical protein VGG10_11050 [Rhizomicrobium sp.]|jgi:hypothetical protein